MTRVREAQCGGGKGYMGAFLAARIFLYHDIVEAAWLYTYVKNIVCFMFKINFTILHVCYMTTKRFKEFIPRQFHTGMNTFWFCSCLHLPYPLYPHQHHPRLSSHQVPEHFHASLFCFFVCDLWHYLWEHE